MTEGTLSHQTLDLRKRELAIEEAEKQSFLEFKSVQTPLVHIMAAIPSCSPAIPGYTAIFNTVA